MNTSRVATEAGLPPVCAHLPLYGLLVDLGRLRPTISKTAVPAGAAGWLGDLLARRVPTVLAGTERIAQEAVTRITLERSASWLEEG